jgi:hypothetical protein
MLSEMLDPPWVGNGVGVLDIIHVAVVGIWWGVGTLLHHATYHHTHCPRQRLLASHLPLVECPLDRRRAMSGVGGASWVKPNHS